MEPILIAIVGFIADKFAAQFVKDDLYTRFREFFFPKPNYRNLLEEAIFATIQNYRALHPQTGDQLPFFLHKDIFDQLTGFVLFKTNARQLLEELYKNNPQVALPSADELNDFYSFFVDRVNKNKKLKRVFIDENYKQEIFNISGSLKTLSEKIDKLISSQELSYSLTIDFYVPRPHETLFYDQLNNNGLLLLSGQSFCGKSQLGKMICRQYIEDGYSFMTSDTIDHCRQQLLKTQKATIYLLEDPFADVYDGDSRRTWRKLVEFIPMLPKQHKLIITSRSEVIREIRQDLNLGNASINHNQWNDLTVTDAEFINEYWAQLSAYKQMPVDLEQIIERYLRKSFTNDYLQPGQLMFLANKPMDQLAGLSEAQLVLLAKADSRDIALEIIGKGPAYQSLYITLGFMCDTIRPVSFIDLAFVLSKSDVLPGFKEEGVKIRSMSIKEQPQFPAYPQAAFPQEYLEPISILQIRGYIKIVNDHILFTHPTYRDTARYIYQIERADLNDLLYNLLLKVLASLQIENILIGITQLAYLLKNRPDIYETLLKLTLRAANATIFPAAEGRLSELLVDKLDSLSPEMQEKVMYLAQHKSDTSSIFWHNGVPFYSEDGINIDAVFGSDEIDNNEYLSCFQKLNNGEYITPGELWHFLDVYQKKMASDPLSDPGALLVLSYPEAFIRSRFAALVFRHGWPANTLKTAILNDQHPEVIVEAIKGCFAGYLNYTEEQRLLAKEMLTENLTEAPVIIRASNFFCTFGLSHATESIEWYDMTSENSTVLWQLWGDIFPIFFEQFPDYLEIPNSARFAKNLHDAAGYITAEQGLVIGNIFFHWISHRLNKTKVMDSHELGLISFLMESNHQPSPERANLLMLALNHPHTGFAGISLAQASWYYSNFSESEIAIIIAAITNERIDGRWLKAIAIAQSQVIPAVQQAVLGDADLLDKAPAEIIGAVDTQLLVDAIHVYTGEPQPLWWYALHHAEKSAWLNVIKHVVEAEYEPAFEICVKEMLGNIINTPGEKWEDGQEIWRKLCGHTEQEVRLAKLLISETAKSNFNEYHAIRLWKTITELFVRKNKLPDLLHLVADKIEALQQYDELDVYKILTPHFNELLDLLPTDKAVLLLIQNLEQHDFEIKLIDGEVQKIMTLAKSHPLRLKLSFRDIKSLAEAKRQKYPMLNQLDTLPDEIDEANEKFRKEMDDHFELPQWVDSIN